MNKVILKGRLTAEPEIKYTQGAEPVAVARFSIAVSRGYKKGDSDVTDFINCRAFRKTAEFIGKYFRKGQEILAEGQLYIDTYESNGEKKKSVYVSVTGVEFCGSKESIAAGCAGQEKNGGNKNYAAENVAEDDDLPF